MLRRIVDGVIPPAGLAPLLKVAVAFLATGTRALGLADEMVLDGVAAVDAELEGPRGLAEVPWIVFAL